MLHKKKPPQKKSRTEKEALQIATEIKTKLDSGADFSELAKEQSDDPISKKRGGDVGLMSKNDPRMTRKGLDEVMEKATTLKVGEVAGPIQTKNGFYIIKLTKGNELQLFDDVKASIEFKIKNDVQKQLVEKLKNKATIKYADESLNTDPKHPGHMKKEEPKSGGVTETSSKTPVSGPTAPATPSELPTATETPQTK